MSISYEIVETNGRKLLHTTMACSVIAIAIATSTAASAQQATAPTSETPAVQDNMRLEEIVVTARKRTEKLDIVPLAITAMTSAKIEARNLKSLEDVASFSPGFYTQQSTNSGFGRNDRAFRQLTFRGIGAIGSNISITAGGVAFLDGAPVLNSSLANVQDLERVEVLRGPQAAYFGRSTFIGAVNYITKDPSNKLSGRVSGEYAEDNLIDVSASISLPIASWASLRLSGRYFSKDGQYRTSNERRRVGDQSTKSFSATLLLKPTDRLKIRTFFNHFEDDDGPPAQYIIGGGTAGVSNCNLGGRYGAYYCGDVPQKANPALISANLTMTPAIYNGLILNDRNFPVPFSFKGRLNDYGLNRKADQFSNRIDYTLNDAGLLLTSVSAYHEEHLATLSDFSFRGGVNPTNNAPILTISTAFGIRSFDYSQELRLVSPQSGRFRWVAGGNYLYVKQPTGYVISSFFGAILNFGSRKVGFNKAETPSVFGGAYFDIVPNLTLSAEARYQADTISGRFAKSATEFITPDPKKTFKSFSPRVSLDYKITPTSTVYALFSRGYKPGGFNGVDLLSAPADERAQILTALPTAGDSFNQERLDNYEAGIKGSFLDGRLRMALNGYIGRYRGAQVPVAVVVDRATNPPTRQTYGPIINIGDVNLKGVEFEGEVIVFPGMRLGATFAYTDSKIIDYYCSECSDIYPQAPGIPPGPSILPNSVNFTIPVGKQLPGTPKVAYTLSANYERKIDNTASIYLGADYLYRGKYFADAANVASSGDSETVNARIGFRKDKYNVELFARNLFDDQSPGIVYGNLAPNAFFTLPSANTLKVALPDRRRIGIRLSANF